MPTSGRHQLALQQPIRNSSAVSAIISTPATTGESFARAGKTDAAAGWNAVSTDINRDDGDRRDVSTDEALALRPKPTGSTAVDRTFQPNPIELSKQPAAHRPPSPFMAQLDVYYRRLAAEAARDARLIPSDVWTEIALRESAAHDWPNNLSQRWRKCYMRCRLPCAVYNG